MTKKLTISVPDHVASRLGEESNASAYVTRCVENEMTGESVRAYLAEHGIVITQEGRARARATLDAAAVRAAARRTPEQHRQALERRNPRLAARLRAQREHQ